MPDGVPPSDHLATQRLGLNLRSTCKSVENTEMESAQPKNINLFPKAVSFGFHTADDIRKISVVQVSNPQTFNALGHPTPSGLYDPLMGPWSERADNCATCQSSYVNCPGHYGHIELPLPVYHPLFLRNLIGIIKLTCPACKRFFLQGNTCRNNSSRTFLAVSPKALAIT